MTLPFKVVTLCFTLLLPFLAMPKIRRFVSIAIRLVHSFFYPWLYNNLFLLYLFQTELLDPALKGTLNVLRSCVNSPTLKRVVLTSSFAAVGFSNRPKTPDVVVDETWYSDPEFCERTGVCAVFSNKLSLHVNPYYRDENFIVKKHTNSKCGKVFVFLRRPKLYMDNIYVYVCALK